VQRAEEEHRVTERVQGWSEDALAEARAQRGAVDPYYGALQDAFEEGLHSTAGGTPAELGVSDANAGTRKSYTDAASNYARTGNPGFSPPSTTPLHSEQLRERFRDEPAAQGMVAMAQAQETRQALAQHVPLFSLKLELQQSGTGALLEAKVVESSGHAPFDAFVLRVTPEALRQVRLPPPASSKGLRSLWQVEGWLKRRSSALADLTQNVSPMLGPIPLAPLVEPLRRPSATDADFEYRARILRVY
jgi:hypothetical protein